MVIPRGSGAWTHTAALESNVRRARWPALLASLGFHGAVLAAVGVAAERLVSNRPPEGYEVTVRAIEELPTQPELEKIFAPQTAQIAAMEIGEPVEPSASDEVRATASAVAPPLIRVAEHESHPTRSEQIVILGLEAEPEPVVASAEPAAAQPAGEVDGTGYWLGVRGKIFEHLVYPRLRRGQSADTNILLRVTIDGTGRLLTAVADSEPTAFTLAAVRAVERAAPFESPASGVPLTMELPVEFRRN